jgi:hypothetical protein
MNGTTTSWIFFTGLLGKESHHGKGSIKLYIAAMSAEVGAADHGSSNFAVCAFNDMGHRMPDPPIAPTG